VAAHDDRFSGGLQRKETDEAITATGGKMHVNHFVGFGCSSNNKESLQVGVNDGEDTPCNTHGVISNTPFD
jgi:hypothetical protein